MCSFDWDFLPPEQVSQVQSVWNDLWWRSGVRGPWARAEALACYWKHFGSKSALVVVVRRRGGAWVGCLPLQQVHVAKMLRAGGLPGNPWTSAGELLLDPTALSQPEFWYTWAQALRHLPWKLLWLNELPVESPWWTTWQQHLAQLHLASHSCGRYLVGLTQLEGTWQQFLRTRSRNFRKSLRRAQKALEQLGSLELASHPHPRWSWEQLWEMAQNVEQHSWKHQQGTAWTQHPQVEHFYRLWSQRLDESNMLALHVLLLDGEPIAYEWGYQAKGTYFPHKCSYHQRFAAHSPGHVLCGMILEQLWEGGQVQQVDYLGPMSEAVRRWSTGHYWSGRVVLGWSWGRGVVGMHRHLLPRWRRLRRATTGEPLPAPLPATTSGPDG